MKFNNKIKINLFNFFSTGKFDCIEINTSKEYILNNFPEPNLIGEINESISIWRYGVIEVSFFDNEVILIMCDDIENLNAGESIELESWLLPKTELTLLDYQRELNDLNIDYQIINKPDNCIIDLKIIQSNVILSFYNFENENLKPSEYTICAFIKSQR